LGSYSGNKGNEGPESEANGKWRRSDGVMKLKPQNPVDMKIYIGWNPKIFFI
jgi:hypothetical protein